MAGAGAVHLLPSDRRLPMVFFWFFSFGADCVSVCEFISRIWFDLVWFRLG